VVAEARKAKDGGATRYCMGAAWRNPKPRDMDAIVEMVGAVKALGLETCMTRHAGPRSVGPAERGRATTISIRLRDIIRKSHRRGHSPIAWQRWNNPA
jgi:hypothetical protein